MVSGADTGSTDVPRDIEVPPSPLLEEFKYRVIDAVLEARAKQLDKEIMELLK